MTFKDFCTVWILHLEEMNYREFSGFTLANSFAHHCKSALTETASFLGHFAPDILIYSPEVLSQNPTIFRGSESGPSPV